MACWPNHAQKLLATNHFTPEQRHVFELAFNATLSRLNLVDRHDPICEMIALKIIEIGSTTNPINAVALTELTLRHFQK